MASTDSEEFTVFVQDLQEAFATPPSMAYNSSKDLGAFEQQLRVATQVRDLLASISFKDAPTMWRSPTLTSLGEAHIALSTLVREMEKARERAGQYLSHAI